MLGHLFPGCQQACDMLSGLCQGPWGGCEHPLSAGGVEGQSQGWGKGQEGEAASPPWGRWGLLG